MSGRICVIVDFNCFYSKSLIVHFYFCAISCAGHALLSALHISVCKQQTELSPSLVAFPVVNDRSGNIVVLLSECEASEGNNRVNN